MSTLADRIKSEMERAGLSNAALAAAARVKPPTAHNWGSGKTKAIKGEPLLRAAAALGVKPEWLATGLGKKYPDPGSGAHMVKEESQSRYLEVDPWTREAVDILERMAPEARRAAVLNLRFFCKILAPENGTARQL